MNTVQRTVLCIKRRTYSACYRSCLKSGTSGSYKIQEEKIVFTPSALKPEENITEESNLLAITTQGRFIKGTVSVDLSDLPFTY